MAAVPAFRQALVLRSTRRVGFLSAGNRYLSTSFSARQDSKSPKGAHADSHAEIPVSRGEPVADGAKEKEKHMSGVPRREEDSAGEYSAPPFSSGQPGLRVSERAS